MGKSVSQKRAAANLRAKFHRKKTAIKTKWLNMTADKEKIEKIPTNSNKSSIEMLQEWAIVHNITKRAISDLLKILIALGLNWLPKDARTLLRSPINVEIKSIANGSYWHNGLAKNLMRIFHNLDRNLELALNLNIDGIPLHNSSKKEFWPILANFHGNFCF